MTNQQILNQLSLIECELYYRNDGSNDREGISYADIEKAHNLVNEALKAWYMITGCTLDPTEP